MAVDRHEPGGIRRPAHQHIRATAKERSRQYRTHRIDHGKWSSHRQSLPATRREFRHRECPGDGRIPNHPAVPAARDPASVDDEVQGFERAYSAVGPFRKWTLGAVTERLRTEFSEASTGDGSWGRCSFPLWRQATSSHGRSESRLGAVQRVVATRCSQRRAAAEFYFAFWNGKDGPVRIRRPAEHQHENGPRQHFPHASLQAITVPNERKRDGMRRWIGRENGPQAIANVRRGLHINAALQADNGVFATVIHCNFDVVGRTVSNSFQAITSYTGARGVITSLLPSST